MVKETENTGAYKTKTVFELIGRFENDDRIAIVCGSEQISYRSFIQSYRLFGGELVRSGVKKGDRVLLCKSRGIGYLTALFGIMAAGGVYIPVDPEWPQERRRFIRKDSKAVRMITDEGICGPEETGPDPVLRSWTDIFREGTDRYAAVLPQIDGEDYCWIYYTSGSTGMPKGAANVHEVMFNNALYCPENIFTSCTVSSCNTVLAMLNLAYSFSLADVLICLCNGIKLILASEEERQDPAALGRCMEKWGVDAVSSTPSLLERYLENPVFESAFRKLKRIGLSGEGLSRRQMEFIAGKTDGKLFNGYGSSEMLHCSDALCEKGRDLAVGAANLDVILHVLKDDLEPAGAGETGELYIGGTPSKHAYYLGREDLNQEKYLLHPALGRLFRTGDGALILENGEIKITGRCDGVMKLHGQRLDPGEIEQVMEQYPGIRKGAVHIQGEGAAAVLCGYYTVRDEVDPAKLRIWLSERLPHYMIPVLFKELKELPLNTNGKLDRKALPHLEETVEHARFEAPSDEKETLLCDLFQEVLGIGQAVGTGDGFFALGGDSISGMRIVSEARNRGWKLELSSLFASPVVKDLARTLRPVEKAAETETGKDSGIKESLNSAEKAAVTRGCPWDKVQAVYPFLPAMRTHLLYQEGRKWDAAEMMNVKVPVDTEKLKTRYAELVSKRAALRAYPVFPEEGRAMTVVRMDPDNPLAILDLQSLADDDQPSAGSQEETQTYGTKISEKQLEYIRSYVRTYRESEPAEGRPAVQTGLIRLGPDNWIVYVLLSHYILDGTGAHRIVEELLGDMPVTDDLKELGSYYRRLASGSYTEEGIRYWKTLAGQTGYTKMPRKEEGSSTVPADGPSFRSRRMPMDRILSFGRTHGVTTAALIHTAVGMALAKLTGLDQVCFATIGNGRDESLTDDERLTGAFSSEMPVVYGKGDRIWENQRQLIRSRNHNVFDFELLGTSFSGEESITGTVRCDILNFPEAKGTTPGAYNIISDQYLNLPEKCLKDVLIYFVLRDDLMMTCEFYPKYADPAAVSKLCRYFVEAMNQLLDER